MIGLQFSVNFKSLTSMKSPIVSVVTPCYNSGNYIGETIESVISQTFQDWEMIIVDDCSDDNSAAIITQYVEKDSRIKYFKTEKRTGSPSAPRNIGVNNSSGQYIAFLDSDDLWLPHKLESQLEYIKRTKSSFVYSNYKRFLIKEKPGGVIKSPSYAIYSTLLFSDFITFIFDSSTVYQN